MLSLAGFQHALAAIYRLDLALNVDDFVRPLDPHDPEAARGEVVLVADNDDGADVAVLLDPRVLAALAGRAPPRHPGARFHAWCLALEGVSHFTLLAWRAAQERPVSQLELELQADVDKFVVGVMQRCLHRAAGETHRRSRALRLALFDRVSFRDPPGSVRGVRYRLAHRLAARYAATLERRFVRDGRLGGMLDEVRAFYRGDLGTKRLMAAG